MSRFCLFSSLPGSVPPPRGARLRLFLRRGALELENSIAETVLIDREAIHGERAADARVLDGDFVDPLRSLRPGPIGQRRGGAIAAPS